MKVSVIINNKAGSVDEKRLRAKLYEALFRCQLQISSPKNLVDLERFINSEIESGTEALLICGGDGTINRCLQPLMKRKIAGQKTVPICIVSSGTANDLANELGINQRIEDAAREIFEGQARLVDVIRVTTDTTQSYMLTNGGFGIPEVTARNVNAIKSFLQHKSQTAQSDLTKQISELSLNTLQTLKSRIYELAFVDSLIRWKSSDWNIELQMDNQKTVQTTSPFIMINNQSKLGAHFTPAPYTHNNDGTFDLMLITEPNRLKALNAIRKIQKGEEPRTQCKHFEIKSLKVRSLNPNRKLRFFGDGESLIESTQECLIECLSPGIEIFTDRGFQ